MAVREKSDCGRGGVSGETAPVKLSLSIKSKTLVARLRKDLQSAQQRAEYWEILAMTDDLTGLHNRRLIRQLGESSFHDRRDPARLDRATLLFIDLDDFGKLNKRYGDDVGDQALRILADGIRKNIRKDDIAIRKGGDEFIIILLGADEESGREIVLKRLQRMLDGDLAVTIGRERVSIRGSVGVFPYDSGKSPFENVKFADELMRRQKQERKGILPPT